MANIKPLNQTIEQATFVYKETEEGESTVTHFSTSYNNPMIVSKHKSGHWERKRLGLDGFRIAMLGAAFLGLKWWERAHK